VTKGNGRLKKVFTQRCFEFNCLDGVDQGQVGFQEGKDLGRVQGVRGEVDDRSGQAFGQREIAGIKPPALQIGLNRMQGGTEPVAQGDTGLLGRRLEGWAIGDPQGYQDSLVEIRPRLQCLCDRPG
jgi:hypothetical protein